MFRFVISSVYQSNLKVSEGSKVSIAAKGCECCLSFLLLSASAASHKKPSTCCHFCAPVVSLLWLSELNSCHNVPSLFLSFFVSLKSFPLQITRRPSYSSRYIFLCSQLDIFKYFEKSFNNLICRPRVAWIRWLFIWIFTWVSPSMWQARLATRAYMWI